MVTNSTPPAVVALVCSAGGLDALSKVLGPLPSDFPAAVIVLQHQQPRERSYLAHILARRCRLPVHAAPHGEPLSEGTVYVIPPGTHALMTAHGTLALIASGGPPPYRPSADLLLCSLAATMGARTVAVVLSGRGNDGATGAVAVHDLGGVVIAADQASSAHYAMPAAAIGRDGAVDFVLPIDQIPTVLNSLFRRTYQEPALAQRKVVDAATKHEPRGLRAVNLHDDPPRPVTARRSSAIRDEGPCPAGGGREDAVGDGHDRTRPKGYR